MSSEAPPKSSLMKWIVPVALFVVIVGLIAWLTQNLPRGVDKKSPVPPPPASKDREPDLRFLYKKDRGPNMPDAVLGIWDEKNPFYAKEFEQGQDGHYDFPFHNAHDYPVTIGFGGASCDCSHLLVTVVDTAAAEKLKALTRQTPHPLPEEGLQWTKLGKEDKKGVEIPPGGYGLARLEWHSRKSPGEFLRVKIDVWMHPAGRPDDRTFEQLLVPVAIRAPMNFDPPRLVLGNIGAGGEERGRIFAWSSTRDKIDLKVDKSKTDELFEVAVKPIDVKDAEAYRAAKQKDALDRIADAKFKEAMQAQHAKETHDNRIKSAFFVDVTVREQKGSSQLDQGHFSRTVPLEAGDVAFFPPTVAGFVRGDIDVGATEDGGKINLKTFSAKAGVKRSILIATDGNADLAIESTYPKALEVKLTRNVKDSTSTRGRWWLDVSVPPGAWYGPFNDDAVIVLRTQSTPPRRIRIPVIGVGGQG